MTKGKRGNQGKKFPLFSRVSQFTDDSVMAATAAKVFLDMIGLSALHRDFQHRFIPELQGIVREDHL